MVAEITNTPWDQRRAYVLRKPASISANGTRKFTFPKDFHVSPFMPMDQRYTWFFNPPDRRLHVHMQNHEEGSKVFDATLSLERQPLSSKTMNTALLRYPLMTWRAMAAIYYQALRLRLKGAPFYSHPQSDQEFFSPKKGV